MEKALSKLIHDMIENQEKLVKTVGELQKSVEEHEEAINFILHSVFEEDDEDFECDYDCENCKLFDDEPNDELEEDEEPSPMLLPLYHFRDENDILKELSQVKKEIVEFGKYNDVMIVDTHQFYSFLMGLRKK